MFGSPKVKQAIIGAGFKAIGSTRLFRLTPESFRGMGVILMFHHVRPATHEAFSPNQLLEITPEFLDCVILLLRRLDYDIVTLDNAIARVEAGDSRRRFAALTFDDGLRDNAQFAMPVLARHGAPFTMFVTPGFADRTANLWWVELELAIRRARLIDLEEAGQRLNLVCETPAQKQAAWAVIYARLRAGSRDSLQATLDRLCAETAIDRAELTASLCLDWDELSRVAAEPLASIGAHTMTHPRLADLPEAEMRREIAESRSAIERRLGCPARNLAYPYGDPTAAGPREFRAALDMGFASAVTTRPGIVFHDHAEHVTALPRLSVNGLYQSSLALEVLLSGAAFALWNRGRRVDAA